MNPGELLHFPLIVTVTALCVALKHQATVLNTVSPRASHELTACQLTAASLSVQRKQLVLPNPDI